jgi:hypothetical protein
VNDLDDISGRDALRGVLRAGNDGSVDLHGDRPLDEPEVLDQCTNC